MVIYNGEHPIACMIGGLLSVYTDVTHDEIDILVREYGLEPYTYTLTWLHSKPYNPNLHPVNYFGHPLVFNGTEYCVVSHIPGIYWSGIAHNEEFKGYKLVIIMVASIPEQLEEDYFQAETLVFSTPWCYNKVENGKLIPITISEMNELRCKVFREMVMKSRVKRAI